MQHLIRIFAISILVLTSSPLFSQGTIDQQFEDFYRTKTSVWQEYKLVKTPRLREFWTIVSDTVADKRNQIAKGKLEIQKLKDELKMTNQKLVETNELLVESNSLNESILFIGIEFNKSFYNGMVWLIILGLSIAIGAIYLLYMRSNQVTKEAQKALASVETEFKDHKDNTREAQIKLKRELQTALNTIHENRLNH